MDNRSKNFLTIPAAPFRGMELSLRAVGMLGRLYALSDGGMTDYELCAACRLNIEDVYEVTGELSHAGYLTRRGSCFSLRKEDEVDGKQAV
ncbi:MAG: hypothetical protein LUG45_03410 [Clostridiales bacterium]|nr:hypothetical protein [Clostridiales bacterium]